MSDLAERLQRVIDRAIAERRIVGTVVVVGRTGAQDLRIAAGFLDREAGTAMPPDAIFRLASFTKPIVAVTALALIERGAFTLDDVVARWLPDFRPKLRDGSSPDISIRHLLTHTSGLRYGSQLPDDPYVIAKVSGGLDGPGLSLDENLARLASVPLEFPPGSAWRYSLAIDVLGAVIAKAHGGDLGSAVREFVTGPLGMRDTAFNVADVGRLAVPYADGTPEPVRMGEPQIVGADPALALLFSPRRALDPRSYQSGGAGLNGTAGDFALFLDALRSGGEPILKPATLALASRNHIGTLQREAKDAGWRFGLISAVLDDPVAAGSPLSTGSLEWGGAWGHRWFVDPAAGISATILTNTAVEGVGGAFPKEVYRTIYGA
jgi:CubicO group peptidase (beta-lactamase class C family)